MIFNLNLDVISQVNIILSSKSITATVRDIMQACNLPHHISTQDTAKQYRGWEDTLEIFGDEKELFASSVGNLNVGNFNPIVKLTLDKWLGENFKTVESNQKNAESLQLGISEIMELLKKKYGVQGLSKDSLHYSYSMVHSGLKQLLTLFDRYFKESNLLKGRLVKFGHFNGIDQLGRMVFNINDLPSDWKLVSRCYQT